MNDHKKDSFTREKALEVLIKVYESGVRLLFDDSTAAREWSGHKLEQSFLFCPLASVVGFRDEAYDCEDNPYCSVYMQELTLGNFPHYFIIPGKANILMNISFDRANAGDGESMLIGMNQCVDHSNYGYGSGVTISIGHQKPQLAKEFDCGIYNAWTPRFFFEAAATTPLHFLNLKEVYQQWQSSQK